MPETGRAAVFKGAKQPFELREFDLPDPAPLGAVVKVLRTNICGTDMHLWRGDTDLAQIGLCYDMILGHEMVGQVYKLGSKVSTDSLGRKLAEGDTVVFTYYVSCGRCPACLNGRVHMCLQSLASPVRPCDMPPPFCRRLCRLLPHQAAPKDVPLASGR